MSLVAKALDGRIPAPGNHLQFSTKTVLAGLCLAAASAGAQPAFSWAKSAGGNNHDSALAIAADASGNSCVTGESASPTIIFDTLILTNQGSHGIPVARYDKAGNVTWARSHGQLSPGSWPSRGIGAAADNASNCFVTGVFSGTVNFGPTNLSSAGFSDMFVAKYNAGGNLVWVQRAGGQNVTDAASGSRVVVDAAGNVCVAGQSSGTVQVTSAAGTNATLSGQGAFIAKYGTNGSLAWVRQISGDVSPAGVASDPGGNICFAGDFASTTISLGGITLTNRGYYDAFVAKLSPQGNFLWAKHVGGSDWDSAVGLASDVASNVYVTCNVPSTNTMVGGTPFTNGVRLLAKLTRDGDVVWAKATPLMGRIAVAPGGQIFMAQSFGGTVAFGSTTLTNAGNNSDAFVAAFDAGGNPMWAKQTGGQDDDMAWDLALDAAGNVYVSGEFQSTTAVFDSFTLTNGTPDSDAFVARIFVPPKLTIESLPGKVRLTWPTNAAGYSLESTTNISLGSWQAVTNSPVVLGTTYAVTSTVSWAQCYFRLTSIPVQPRLDIQPLPGKVRLTWPTNTVGYSLESSTNIISGSWQAITNSPIVLGTSYAVTAAVTRAECYFRLKRL